MLALAFCDLWRPWPSPEDPWIGTSLWRDYIVTATPLVLVAVALHSEDGGSPMLFCCPACAAVPSDHLPSDCVLLLRAQSPGCRRLSCRPCTLCLLLGSSSICQESIPASSPERKQKVDAKSVPPCIGSRKQKKKKNSAPDLSLFTLRLHDTFSSHD